jgi:hypothetical protein
VGLNEEGANYIFENSNIFCWMGCSDRNNKYSE